MKRIKDFFYNCNDLIVILLILAAAAALIYWRVNIIMDYPKTLAVEIQETGTAEGLDIDMSDVENDSEAADEVSKEDAEATDEKKDGDSTENDKSAEGNVENNEGTDSNDENTEGTDQEQGDAEEAPAELVVDGALTKEITVAAAEGTAEETAQAFIDLGIFSSYDDYYEVCVNSGIDPTQIVAGSYTFPAGTTLEAIVSQITQSQEG